MSHNSTVSYLKPTSIYTALCYLIDPMRIVLKINRHLLKYGHLAYFKTFYCDCKKTNFNRIAMVNLLVSQKPDCTYLEIDYIKSPLPNPARREHFLS